MASFDPDKSCPKIRCILGDYAYIPNELNSEILIPVHVRKLGGPVLARLLLEESETNWENLQKARQTEARYKREERTRARHQRMVEDQATGDIITFDAFKRAALAKNINLDWSYLTFRGAEGFNTIVNYKPPDGTKNPYLTPRSDHLLLEHHAAQIKTAGRRLASFGGGDGPKEARQIKHGMPVDVVDIDLSFKYFEMFERTLIDCKIDSDRIGHVPLDFFRLGDITNDNIPCTDPKSVWTDENWKKNITKGDNTPITFTMYGNTLGNPTWPEAIKFLKNLHAKMRPGKFEGDTFTGDIAYISLDCTVEDDLLKAAYSIPPWEPWFKETLTMVYERKLGMGGINWDDIRCRADVKHEDGHHVVYIFLDVGKKQPDLHFKEKHPRLSTQERKTLLSEFAGSSIQMLRSRRSPVQLLRSTFQQVGFDLVDPLGLPANDDLRLQGADPRLFSLARLAA